MRPGDPNIDMLELMPSGQIIRTLTPPHFLATKFEAFHGRGKGDYWASHDMEDIVCVIDGRAEITAEVAASSPALRQYLQAEFTTLLADWMFTEAISGFLPGDAISQTRAPLILRRIAVLAEPKNPIAAVNPRKHPKTKTSRPCKNSTFSPSSLTQKA